MGMLHPQLNLTCDLSFKVRHVGQRSNYQKRPITPGILKVNSESILALDRKVAMGMLYLESSLTCDLSFSVKQIGQWSNR